MISHTTAQSGRHRHYGSGDKMVLFISQDDITKGLSNMGMSP